MSSEPDQHVTGLLHAAQAGDAGAAERLLAHNLGVDVGRTTVQDLNGRPQYLVADHAGPLPERR